MRLWRKLTRFIADVIRGNQVDKGLVIVRIDGGICSQIAFLALGKYMEDKGYRVKYDLSWFQECGKDMDGKFERNFDLAHAFPALEIEQSSRLENYRYSKRYKCSNLSLDSISPPAYLGDYYDRWPLVIEYRDLFRGLFKPDNLVFDSVTSGLVSEIKQEKSPCAVHVRRGDLGVYNKFYGSPLEVDYFNRAIRRVEELFPGTKFYFFSDEIDWLERNLIPTLGKSIQYELVAHNGSDKGYLDLYIMAKCRLFISSHGSLAKYARVLARDDAFIIEPSSKRDFDKYLIDNAEAMQ